jgi:hypothetical protein
MNKVFKSFLRKFILLFFDNILIYYSDLTIRHSNLAQVLQEFCENYLTAKRSKYKFRVHQVEYLGHIISESDIAADPKKK